MDVQSVAPAVAAEQQTAPAPAVPAGSISPNQTQAAEESRTLSPVVANLFSQGAILQHVSVDVSYRVENGAIVTVFTDPKTGKEITQVPAEVLVQIAQFFDKHHGVTLDKSA